MSSTHVRTETAIETPRARTVDMKLEVVVIPVSDADRAKVFYDNPGWRLDADFVRGDAFRVVQFTPPGSSCSIHFGKGVTSAVPGSARGLFLVVSDVEAARTELVDRGVEVSDVFHRWVGEGPQSGKAAADAPVIQRMCELARQYPRYGYRRIRIFMTRDGHRMSVGRAYRLWRAARLQVPRKRPRNRVCGSRPRPLPPQSANQVWSYIPPIRPITTRIELFRATCPCCKARVTASAPADMPEGTPFGPGITSAIAYLHGCQMVSFKRLTEVCQGLLGLTISQGAIVQRMEFAI